MTERKFTRSLNKPGMASRLRETVSQVVRESTVLNKPLVVEPIDFETFILKNKTLIQNDPQRELLMYPTDDVSQVILPRKFRTVTSNIPSLSPKKSSNCSTASSSTTTTTTVNGSSIDDCQNYQQLNQSQGLLLTRQSLHTYQSNNHLVHYKYNPYSGSHHDLPRTSPVEELREEIYEIDADPDRIDEQMTRSQADSITKQGFLYKGPDTSSDRMFAHIASKSFKRRYCYLRQEVDGTYILEIHKDEKQVDVKATIIMDFCTEVVQNSKRGRFCFELRMTAGHKSFTLAAESETEMQDWLQKLQSILQQNKLQEDKRAASLERAPPSSPGTMMFGTLKGLDQSMNPQLIKYGRETDLTIAQARREHRRKLFCCMQNQSKIINNTNNNNNSSESPIEPYREQFGQRILVKCENLKFRLQTPISTSIDGSPVNVNNDGEILCQVEPYITSLALYDARAGKKLTENFYFDINHKQIRDTFQLNNNSYSNSNNNTNNNNNNSNNGNCYTFKTNQLNGNTITTTTTSTTTTNRTSTNNNCDQYHPASTKIPFNLSKELDKLPNEWLMFPRQSLINITVQHPDIFLVVKIDKILQGGINATTDPYLKATKDLKLGLKLHRNVKLCNQKIGYYRMPFGWAARPLFRLYSSELDTTIEFPAIYRQEANKLKDDDLLKLLADYRKPDKFSKLTVIPGWLKITIEPITTLPNNTLTTTLAPLKPFPVPPTTEPTIEIAEFLGNTERDVHPYTTFINHLFIYPLSLNFDCQKLFSRARNLSILIELRDSDDEDAKGIPCIYSRPGRTKLLTQISCPVLHHSTNPSWYEEIKLCLPLNITTRHHILFSFIHVSCNLSKKRDINASFENSVGYAWIPLLNKGKINIDEQIIPVAATLPIGYLSIQPLGLGKGQNAGPEIQWIDNQRPIFSVTFRLDSTVLTTDQHLHNLFVHIERILQQQQQQQQQQQHQSLLSASSPIKSVTSPPPSESETCKILKAAHAIQITSIITFLPTILNQLFILLVNTNSEEIGLNVIRLLVHLIHMVADEAGRKELLLSYIKYNFQSSIFYKTNCNKSSNNNNNTNSSPTTNNNNNINNNNNNNNFHQNTVHGELFRHLPTLLHPNNTDFLLVHKFMKYSNIFFELIIKSMAQHLMSTGRIRMHRNERFPKDYPIRIESLFQILVPYLFTRYKDLPYEIQQLNRSLAFFIKKCLTFMDRGFVFKLIRLYMDRFAPGDQRTLYEYKFQFLNEICSHEHYVPLNLPFLLSPKNRLPDILQHFTLSEEFCRQHFLAGLLLQEIKSSLNEVGHIRRLALNALKELLAKHDLDDRYQSKGQMSRIALLYVPWLGIVLENLNRIYDSNDKYHKEPSTFTIQSTLNQHNHLNGTTNVCGGGGIGNFIVSTTNNNSMNNLSTNNNVTPPLSNTNSLSSTNATPKSRNRLTLHIVDQHPSPFRASIHLKDTNYFAAIAGQQYIQQQSSTSTTTPTSIITNGHSTTSLNSDCSTLSQDTTIIRNPDGQIIIDNTVQPSVLINGHHNSHHHHHHHTRSISVTQPTIMARLDKFSTNETKDLLFCFLFVVKHLATDQMVMWWQNCTEMEIISFFNILDLCVIQFRYVGKKNISLMEKSKDMKMGKLCAAKASTLPARMAPPTSSTGGANPSNNIHDTGTLTHVQQPMRENLIEETTRQQQALQDSNIATEIGLILLDCMGLYSIQFRDKLLESSILPKLARVYLRFLQLGQSETLSKHIFAALRAFINNFSPALFKGNASLCGQLVYELLKCCDSRLVVIRQESCAVLYLLMRSNFEFCGRKGLTRVHLQVIISVSQMIGNNVIGLNNARFQESLSLINSYASSDKAMKGTGFPMEVKDLTKRVRTVLMATAQMQSHQMDPERLLELQHSLANSYASTPELRHTWLVTMARNHEQNGNVSEAACCYLHIAALMAEYLNLKGCGFIKWGAESFVKISRNIPRDEKGLKLDSGAQDSQYTEQMLLDQLRECAVYIDRAERYECLGQLYRLIIPILEHKRDYISLSTSYEHLSQVYGKITEVNRSGKRMLGRFYRVVFFGQMYFEEDSGVEYVYKEPKITSLSEISERLYKQFKDKLGTDSVKMIMDSSPVDVNELDPKLAYIQVTHVIPYFCKDELECRLNEFEQNHDVDTFMFETPFTKNGTARGIVEEQWKRRTILTTNYSFPYILKRIQVRDKQSIELSPIEVAIDEMQNRVAELEEVVLPPIDVKKLQLRLQGSVAVTVNAGPLAYATAFLDPKQLGKYSNGKVEDLKEIFREFIHICNTALQVNGRMISTDQLEYHSVLKDNYLKLCSALTDLLDESFLPEEDDTNAHRNSIALFSAISGAPSNSSNA